MLSVEQIPHSIIQNAISHQRTNDDVGKFHEMSIVNKMFSFLFVNKVDCPKKHRTYILKSTLGFDFNMFSET